MSQEMMREGPGMSQEGTRHDSGDDKEGTRHEPGDDEERGHGVGRAERSVPRSPSQALAGQRPFKALGRSGLPACPALAGRDKGRARPHAKSSFSACHGPCVRHTHCAAWSPAQLPSEPKKSPKGAGAEGKASAEQGQCQARKLQQRVAVHAPCPPNRLFRRRGRREGRSGREPKTPENRRTEMEELTSRLQGELRHLGLMLQGVHNQINDIEATRKDIIAVSNGQTVLWDGIECK